MKQIIFKKIQIQNFLSIGDPLSISFKEGLNVITGDNLDDDTKNGVGKSSIPDALYFALFGETIRNLKKHEIINDINNHDCQVILSFDIIENGITTDYILLRSLEPTKCKLYCNNGTNDLTCSSMPKTTKYICELLNSSPEVFEHGVVMTSNNTMSFMSQKKVDKRKFIEGILNIEIFSEMLLAARQEYNDIKKELEIESARHDEIKKNFDIYVEHQKENVEQREQKIVELNERLQQNEKIILDYKEQLDNAKENILNDLNDKISLLEGKKKQCDLDNNTLIAGHAKNKEILNIIDKKIASFTNLHVGDICNECEREYSDDDILSHNKKKIKSYTLNHNKLSGQINTDKIKLEKNSTIKEKCEKGIGIFKQQSTDETIKIEKNDDIEKQINQFEEINEQLNTDLQEIENKKDEYTDLIKDAEIKSKSQEDTLENLKNRINNLDVIKFIVSEEGVKSFIVKKMLKILNNKLKYYLTKMEAPCDFKFNEYFDEIITNKNGKLKSYFNFSNGEQKRIDLGCLFTFMDIRRLQGNTDINILFFDELLDTSLDDKGIERALEILRDRTEKYNESIYLISHRREAVDAATNEIIFLEKKNGFTTLNDTYTGTITK